MKNRAIFVLLTASVLLSASCAQSISRSGEYGKITVAFGGHRSFETGWPGGTVPAFSSVTVTVSASDMDTVTVSSTSSSGSLTVEVPAGNNRRVAIHAVPTAGSGTPFFAKAYGGSSLVDVAAGEQKAVTIKLQLSESKLVLPGYNSGEEEIFYANSIGENPVLSALPLLYFGTAFDPALDTYGRLYYFEGEDQSTYRATTNSADTEFLSTVSGYGSTTYSASKHRFYYSSGGGLFFADMTSSGPTVASLNTVPGFNYNSVMAADDSFLYIDATNNDTGEAVILQLSVTDGGTVTLANLPFSHYQLGLAVMDDFTLSVSDMQVQDGVLYIAAQYVYPVQDPNYAFSRGKVIAFSTSSLGKLWEAGWSGNANNFPTSPTTQFYGPQRFVGIAPKKLYLIDEGFSWDGGHYAIGHYAGVHRVVELDVEKRAISAIGIDGVLQFFDTTAYEETYVC